MTRIIFFILLIFQIALCAQENNEPLKVVGDLVEGKVINGKSIREWIGNVSITQGDVNITCEKAVQFLDENRVDLIGNVIGKQDTITILTPYGRYYGNNKIAFSDSSIVLNDGHIILSAERGYYFFDENRSMFYDNVKLFDKVNTLFSDKLNYFQDIDKAIATGNVAVADTSSAIYADSLIHYRNQKLTYAYSNVKVTSPENNVVIKGNELVDNRNNGYTRITKSPQLIKIDTVKSGTIDTLIIVSKTMESYSDSSLRLIAQDSVKIIRGEFSSVNKATIYYRDEDKILTYKNEDDVQQPILWYQNSQLMGDSVYVYMDNKALKKIEINNNATIFSKSKLFDFRFDQISGDTVWLSFKDNQLSSTKVFGNMLSIYYVIEGDNESNGLVKSSANKANFIFKNNQLSGVELFGKPETEYHPEQLIFGKEKEFTLPNFVLYNNKPIKSKILK